MTTNEELTTTIKELRQQINKLETEIDRLRRDGVPGVMHSVDQSFYNLAIKERDAAWAKIEQLKTEINRFRQNYGLPINTE